MEATRSGSKSSTADPSAQPGRFSSVYKVLQDAIDARAFPGCAFGVLSGGTVVLQDALGHFTYDDSTSVQPHTVYDIASLTKVIATTATAMLLYQQGQLDLDQPLGDLLPGFVVGHPNAEFARRVTIANLLAHNSGLPGYVEFFRTATTPQELFRDCLELPLQAPPGERSEYSDPGFILLGKALEILTHESLASWTRKNIFEPLTLTGTGFTPEPQQRLRIPPTEIDHTFRKRLIQGEVQDENAYVLQGVAGHAGLFSNVPDLLRFSAEILSSLSDPSESDRHLFHADTIRRFSELQSPKGSSQALGWDTPSPDSSSGHHFSARSIGHLGYSGCSLWIDLDASVAVVLLTNRTWPDRQNQAVKQVRPAFHDAGRQSL
jgi:CubicO group peptidase (beta-lactamase class C family)